MNALGQGMGHISLKLAKMKENLQQTPLFNTTELCSHSQPSQDLPSLHLGTRQLVQIATVV